MSDHSWLVIKDVNVPLRHIPPMKLKPRKYDLDGNPIVAIESQQRKGAQDAKVS